MKPSILFFIVGLFCSGSVLFSQTTSGKHDASSTPPPSFTAEYPEDAGVLIENSGWIEVPDETPSDTKMKRGILPALTYGAIPAKVVSIFDGAHAQVQVRPGRPILCICHAPSLHSAPVLVKLHPKKDSRELDGGRLHIGAKVVEAPDNDLMAVDVLQPEKDIWLLRPSEPLPPGEYAVMLGTKYLSIFPFTVLVPPNDAKPSHPANH